MAGFEAAARNFYQHGMAVFNPEKEKYIFCKAGPAAFLMASGSIVPHLFEAPERTEIVDLAREYHGETETFANLSSMFITKQDDLEGAESDDEAAATQPKAKIPLIDQCLALTKIARDSNIDSESLADVFRKEVQNSPRSRYSSSRFSRAAKCRPYHIIQWHHVIKKHSRRFG